MFNENDERKSNQHLNKLILQKDNLISSKSI